MDKANELSAFDEKRVWSKLANLCVVVFLIAYLVFAMLLPSEAIGESSSFMMSTVALANGFSLQITQEYYELACELFPEHAQHFDFHYHSYLPTDDTGNVYPWYFGAYAFLCIPMFAVLLLFSLDPAYAFSITNALLLSLSLWVVYRFAKLTPFKKLLAILLLGLSPVVRYIQWQSYEVATFAFVVMATVFWLNRSRKCSALFLSIAGTMNPTAMAFGIFMIVDFFWEMFLESGKDFGAFLRGCVQQWKRILLYAACFVPCLIPVALTYAIFGHFNISAMEGYGSTQGVFGRAMAYLFDLNFGLLPYIPVLMVLFVVVCVLGIRKRRYDLFFTMLGVIATILAYCLIMHINCGMTGIARYNSWLLPIISMTVIYGIDISFATARAKRAVCAFVTISGVWCTFMVGFTAISSVADHIGDNLSWSPAAKLVLDYAPGLYNPLPSTFNSRTNHVDGGYTITEPVLYINDSGEVRKVLVPPGMLEETKAMLWTSDDHEQEVERQYTKIAEAEDFAYLNFGPQTPVNFAGKPYEVGTQVLFTTENGGTRYFTSGISHIETDYAWTDGKTGEMILSVDEAEADLEMSIQFKMIYRGTQRLIVRCGDNVLYSDTVTMEQPQARFLVPAECVDNGRLALSFEYPDSISPQTMGESADTRNLAFAFESFVMDYADDESR